MNYLEPMSATTIKIETNWEQIDDEEEKSPPNCSALGELSPIHSSVKQENTEQEKELQPVVAVYLPVKKEEEGALEEVVDLLTAHNDNISDSWPEKSPLSSGEEIYPLERQLTLRITPQRSNSCHSGHKAMQENTKSFPGDAAEELKRSCGFASKQEAEVHLHKHPAVNSYWCSARTNCLGVKTPEFRKGLHSNVRSYTCTFCHKSFAREANLDRHIQVHKRDRPFRCFSCKMSFMDRDTLINHMRNHMNERPFKCSICEESFVHREHLVTHLENHTEQRPFECSVCDRSFSLKWDLDVHQRTHSEKPFECVICKKSFAQKHHLISHLRTHSGEKPFECPTCKKCFSEKKNLVTHLQTHSCLMPFHCSTCKKSFPNRETLVKHRLNTLLRTELLPKKTCN